MQRTGAAVMVMYLMGTSVAWAQDVSPTTALVAASADAGTVPRRHTLSMAHQPAVERLTPRKLTGLRLQQPASQRPSWIARHPTLFGLLVGAGGGAASSAVGVGELYCANGGDEDCLFHGAGGVLFGTALGAGVGALIGYLVGR